MSRNLSLIVAGLLALTLAFQNCATKPGDSASVVPTVQGNGEGYSGKITYASRAGSASPCGDGKANTVLVVEDGARAFLTRSNCVDQAATLVPFSSVDFLPHNLQNVGYAGFAFDRESGSSALSTLFCRGRSTDVTGQNQAADAVIKTWPGSPVTYTGRAALGLYDAQWKLKETKDMGEIPVFPDSPIAGRQFYNSQPGGPHIYTLDILLADMTARLTYADAPVLTAGQPPPVGAFNVVTGMTCYVQ